MSSLHNDKFICADSVPEFDPILYLPTNDEEVIASKQALENIVKQFPRLKAKLVQELDYQITRAETNQVFDRDIIFSSYALHILAHVNCREAINYVVRILNLNQPQSEELDLPLHDLEQVISTLIIEGDESKLFKVLKNENLPLESKATLIQPLGYMIAKLRLSRERVARHLIPVLQEAVINDNELGKVVTASIITTTIINKINTLKEKILELHKDSNLDFVVFENEKEFLAAYDTDVQANYEELLVDIPDSIEWLKTTKEQQQLQQEMLDMEATIAKNREDMEKLSA